MSAIDPILDNWYLDAASGRQFRIVALDEKNESIEVQFLNGDLGEYDCASWDDSDIARIEAPEDWSAPFDDVELDDLGYTDPDLHGRDASDMTLDDLLDEQE